MNKALPFSLLFLAVAACSAPQGKKHAYNDGKLPPIAAAEPVEKADIYESQKGGLVALKLGGTLTVWLSSNQRSGFSWRLSEIPDPTVLKLVSKEYLPPSDMSAGQEKWIFEAVGEGDVDLRMWYASPRRQRFGTAPVFSCMVSVGGGELEPVARGPGSKSVVPLKSFYEKPRPRSKSKPKAHPTGPDPETAPFLEPVFRSSRMLLRDQRDGGQKQG